MKEGYRISNNIWLLFWCDLICFVSVILYKMAAISQTKFSDAFSLTKHFLFWLKFHWRLFLRVQSSVNYYLNQCWPDSLTYICGTRWDELTHCSDDIMGAIASQITSLTIVYLIVNSGTDQRKHQSSASLAFVRGIHQRPVNSPHKWPVTRKRFHLMTKSCEGFTYILRGWSINIMRIVRWLWCNPKGCG